MDALYVHTMAVNEIACSFYERHGFVVEKVRWVWLGLIGVARAELVLAGSWCNVFVLAAGACVAAFPLSVHSSPYQPPSTAHRRRRAATRRTTAGGAWTALRAVAARCCCVIRGCSTKFLLLLTAAKAIHSSLTPFRLLQFFRPAVPAISSLRFHHCLIV